MSESITCNRCAAVWTGSGRCHHSKAGCHQTFGGEQGFLKHLRNGKCIDPATISDLKQNSDGIWVGSYGE